MALVKLLQHGVATNDARLQEISVKGDEIIVEAESGRRMTRSARRQQPTQWTQVPVLAKIFKVHRISGLHVYT